MHMFWQLFSHDSKEVHTAASVLAPFFLHPSKEVHTAEMFRQLLLHDSKEVHTAASVLAPFFHTILKKSTLLHML